MKTRLLGLFLGFCLLGPAAAQDVVLRHNLPGKALAALSTAVVEFNDAQKGKSRVVLQNANALTHNELDQLPHFALLDLDDSPIFFGTRPAYVPLHVVLKDAKESIDSAKFYPQIRDAVSDSKGRLEALPAGLAFPALYRNRDLFANAKLDPDKVPQTWMEIQEIAGVLQESGVACPITSANVARLHAEHLSMQHGQGITDKQGLAMNSLINVKHMAMLTTWQRSSYFKYFGRHREAEDKFLTGECAMITTDTTLLARLADMPQIRADISSMPHHDDAYVITPERMLPDGASFWTLAGHKKEEYKVIARFLKFFSQAKVQSDWVGATAYLPMSPAAMKALKSGNAFPPALLERAEKRLQVVVKDSGRIRLEADRIRMREILAEEIETIWTQGIAPMEAMNRAVERVNAEQKSKK